MPAGLLQPHLLQRTGDEDLVGQLVQALHGMDLFHPLQHLVRERAEAEAELAQELGYLGSPRI